MLDCYEVHDIHNAMAGAGAHTQLFIKISYSHLFSLLLLVYVSIDMLHYLTVMKLRAPQLDSYPGDKVLFPIYSKMIIHHEPVYTQQKRAALGLLGFLQTQRCRNSVCINVFAPLH